MWNHRSRRRVSIADATQAEILQLREQIEQLRVDRAAIDVGAQTSMRGVLLAIVDAIDGFDRVFDSVHEKQDLLTDQMRLWIGNFRTLRRLLTRILYDQGVIPMEIVALFDPEHHEIWDVRHDTAADGGTILGVVQEGHFWRSQVLRKARVIVAAERTNGDPTPPDDTASEATN